MGIKLYCKTNISKLDNGYNITYDGILTVGKIYYGDKIKMNENSSLYKQFVKENNKDTYIVCCDDDRNRRIDADFFMTPNEFRNKQLNKLGI